MTSSFDGLWRSSAAPPQQLADELHSLVLDPEVDVVLTTAGGYTTTAVLPYLDFGLLGRAGKPLIGYSDVSLLLLAAHAAGAPAVHGPMLVSEFGHPGGLHPYTAASLSAVLAGRGQLLAPPGGWTDDNPWWDRDDHEKPILRSAAGWRALRHGAASGPLVAVCLPAVSALFGTPYMPSTDGAILFLEDFGIGPDKLLALLSQWRLSGRLERAAGLVIGRRGRPGMSASGYVGFDEVILSMVKDFNMPVVADVDFGHTHPMLALPYGAPVQIDTTCMTIDVGACPGLRAHVSSGASL